jgi:hypothetical protein
MVRAEKETGSFNTLSLSPTRLESALVRPARLHDSRLSGSCPGAHKCALQPVWDLEPRAHKGAF